MKVKIIAKYVRDVLILQELEFVRLCVRNVMHFLHDIRACGQRYFFSKSYFIFNNFGTSIMVS